MACKRRIVASAIAISFAFPAAEMTGVADDWPQWGGTPGRNMVSAERNLPDLLRTTAQNELALRDHPAVRWSARVGYTMAGTPAVAGGRVLVGTAGTKCGLLLCLDEKTGKFLWQLRSPWRDFIAEDPLRPAAVEPKSPWDYLITSQTIRGLGFTSSPTIDGNEVYSVTPRGEVVCLDLRGVANGNQGPFTGEDAYQTADGRGAGYNGADILWLLDLWKELRVRPADTTAVQDNRGVVSCLAFRG
jgi:outer membrane protein assembly factor BamB